MATSARRARAQLTQVMRAEGKTWAQIAAVIRDRYGVNARIAFRWAHGWTQEQAAERWSMLWPDDPRTNQNISTWERWPEGGYEPSISTLSRLARVYECDLSHLVSDIGCYSHLDTANAAPVIRSVAELTGPDALAVASPTAPDMQEGTDRRSFTKAAVLTALGITDPLREILSAGSTERVTVIGAEHVRLIEKAVERIEARDAVDGAADIRASAAALRRQVENWLNRSNYSVHRVEGALQALLGELSAWTGWLALDADDRTDATRHLHDALVQARLTDDPQLEVRALTYICLLALQERPRESLQSAEAALRLARPWATPRLAALLHLRAARAHASLGEHLAFGSEIAKAKSQLDLGVSDDDPLYVHFVGPMEAAGITGLSYLAMGKPERAEREFREITENPSSEYRRNTGYYTVRLAEAIAKQRDLSQAAQVGLSAIPLVAGLGSGRTARYLRNLRIDMEPHRSTVPAAKDFLDAYQETFSS